jgi:hypothetical protein
VERRAQVRIVVAKSIGDRVAQIVRCLGNRSASYYGAFY